MAIAVKRELTWERGVHVAPCRVGGDRLLLAIDSRGELVRKVRLRPGVDEGIARAFLEGLLAHDDPEEPEPASPTRALFLVGALPPSRPPSCRPWRLRLPRLRRLAGIS